MLKNDEIIKALKNERKINQQRLQELVKERVKETSKDKFSTQEIYYYSNYFHMSMPDLLLTVLCVTQQDYQKFVKGNIKHIRSEEYEKIKSKYIQRKKTIFKNKINWNRRTYYNRTTLLKSSKKYEVNERDFCIRILNKSKLSTRRVLNDITDKKRLFIGQYVNAPLPKDYFEANEKDLMRIVKGAVRRAIYRSGKRIPLDDYKELIHSTSIFINYNGNTLKKNNQPKIITNKLKKRDGSHIYSVAYFYALTEASKRRKELLYNDEIKYSQNSIVNTQDAPYFLEELSLNSIQKTIASKICAGYLPEEICKQEEITLTDYQKIVQEIKAYYCKEFNYK